ncbi:GIN domain-containing protein [Mucilaginibacter panaciglaebae]|uniref:Putative auto-transporter adhesin head GIN domain-containing protein n=1 Tax=Mucilaginibacter panaciglaebae TaxID=502331 RepID=A0ABP7WG09_9SPHI
MKTRIVTLITLLTVVLGISVSSAATINNNITETPVLVATNNINKIEASGNVEVYITNGDNDQVKVYDKYYAKNALVQDKDGVLRIASYSGDKLVVLVTVSNLQAITAYDNATIKSYGKLSLIDLTLVLNNQASAQLNFDALNANITLNNRAKAQLSGSVVDYNLAYSPSSTLNKTDLTVINVGGKRTAAPQAEEKIASL